MLIIFLRQIHCMLEITSLTTDLRLKRYMIKCLAREHDTITHGRAKNV